ncbi:ent-kaurene oxidase [Verticillium dahliae VdLs.17]|uniref:Ent-kaurene oxidase n=1 Tax=Verticillium dahliae (strain VdLs.17 / ATCC MYA-4575 / FGSC 10137) TaxID=498257 RepID=G2X5B5_VERDV|nr:ent-kaurene oxidase [Verticillium dahliae VdLs.17]EGY14256.1 ent-kaurene oxidase [Verticillium dahliae VdLs.17]
MSQNETLHGGWLSHPADSFEIQFYRPFFTLILALLVPAAVASLYFKEGDDVSPKWPRLEAQKQKDFLTDGSKYLEDSKKMHSDDPFTMLTDRGMRTVFPAAIADVIRNMTSLRFSKSVADEFHAGLTGFEPFAMLDNPTQVLQRVVRKQLTQRLNWREIKIESSVSELVARISSRVFLGEELCRHEKWLEITQSYTVASFRAAAILRTYPRILRPLVNWFHPNVKVIRGTIAESRRIIGSLVERRQKLRAEAQANGLPVPTFNDAIEWAELEADGYPCDPAVFQLTLSFAAIRTTTDLLTQVMLRLAHEPENIEPLRKEMIEILQVDGWTKNALFKMKLLDSAIKEAQRLKPINMLEMRRMAVEDVTFPDGTLIRKGAHIAINNTSFSRAEVYEDYEKFDIYRFKRMRDEPGKEHTAQLVSTSLNHLSFGHGKFACPGRFFVSNELKLALCHLLLKYDWKSTPGVSHDPLVLGTTIMHNPETSIQFRRRKEEIDLESLEIEE